jgi:hypothetical protein
MIFVEGEGMSFGVTKRRIGFLGAVAAAALALAGCHYAGSGTVVSQTGYGKAAFSFDLSCTPGTTVQKGTLTFTDSPAGVLFRGTVNGTPAPGTCTNNTWTVPSTFPQDFVGTYTPLKGGTSGTFDLDVSPGSAPANNHAHFNLTLTGGQYDGYHIDGPVTAGSIVAVGGPNA